MKHKRNFLPFLILFLLFTFSSGVSAQKDDKFLVRGRKLSDRKKYVEAVEAYKKSLETNPNWKAAYFIGNDFLRRENAAEAIVYFQKALQYKENEPMIWYSLGYSHGKLNENVEAVTALKKAVELKPDYADAWYNLGSVLFKLERFDEAVQAYQTATKYNPNDAEAYAFLGTAYENLDNLGKAFEAFQKAVKLAPSNNSYRQNLTKIENKLKQSNQK